MTIKELMTKVGTPDPAFRGILVADDWVTAIDTTPASATATKDEEYAVLQEGLTSAPVATNPETKQRQYIRGGKQTVKTGSQLTIALAGTHYIGDAALDYILADARVFGIGQDVVTNFIHYNIKTGKGVKGKCSISIESYAGGAAGEDSTFSATLSQTESQPAPWIYTTV